MNSNLNREPGGIENNSGGAGLSGGTNGAPGSFLKLAYWPLLVTGSVLAILWGFQENKPSDPHAYTLYQKAFLAFIVVDISALWFAAFVGCASGHRSLGEAVLAVIPAVILYFFVPYDPTVLAMAFVAIFVAAEHYGGLVKQEVTLEEQKRTLNEQKDVSENLARTVALLDKNVEELRENVEVLRENVGKIVQVLRVAYGRDKVYEKYAAAKEIRAAVRKFDFDALWWTCQPSEHRDDISRWEAFESAIRRSEDSLQLYTALAGDNATAPKDAIFVFATPDLPTSIGSLSREQFQQFIGLAWYCLVFEKARVKNVAQAGPKGFVAAPSLWVHVIGEEVLLVDKALQEPTAAPIVHERAFQKEVRDWASRTVESTAERGCRLLEYLDIVLSLGALALTEEGDIDEQYITGALIGLGMKDWAEWNGRALCDACEPEEAESRCVDIFCEIFRGRQLLGEKRKKLAECLL